MAQETITLGIDGMHCDACVRRVSKTLERAGAARIGSVTIGRAEVQAPGAAAPTLIEALAKAGFAARLEQ